MNYYIRIAREVIGITGYKTIEYVDFGERYEMLKKVEDMEVIRRFPDPFNSSVEVVVVKEV